MSKARELSVVPQQSIGFKNRIINGAMQIDQRNAGASVTAGSGSTAGNYLVYPVDRMLTQSYSSTAGNGAAFTAQQNAGSVTPPSVFKNYLGITVTSTQATLQSSSVYRIVHRIEGYNIVDIGWGTANASSVTLSFWVRSSVTGIYSGAVTNAGSSGGGWMSYAFTFSINSANTWEQKTIVIPAVTSGSWTLTNTIGIELSITFGVSSNLTTTANTWVAAESYGASGGVNLMATNGATFYITGVQLEKGSNATSFDYRPYGTELALCQRYYQLRDSSVGIAPGNTTQFVGTVPFGIDMRSAPSVGLTSALQITDTYIQDYTQSSANIAINAGRVTVRAVNITCGNFTGLTSGRTYITNATASSITLSAEL